MKTKHIISVPLCLSWLLTGCVNHADDLGAHVVKLRSEQTYNLSATRENLAIIPEGSGERMEGVNQVYTGKQDADLEGTDSQFIQEGQN